MDWIHEEPLRRLRDLLGPKPNHPWSALIPQLLLWCFRRFCIAKLMEASSTPLMDQVWDTHHDLVTFYAPRGLTTVGETWLTPENIEHLHSSLEDYQMFFLDFLDLIDTSIKRENEIMQNYVSEFLDIQIRDEILNWLSGPFRRFLIYPLKDSQEDVFTDIQFMALIQMLLQYSKEVKEEEAKKALEAARLAQQKTEDSVRSAPQQQPQQPPQIPDPPQVPQQQPPPQIPDPPQVPADPLPPPSKKVATALHRRRTIKLSQRQRAAALAATPGRVRTRRKAIEPQTKESAPAAPK